MRHYQAPSSFTLQRKQIRLRRQIDESGGSGGQISDGDSSVLANEFGDFPHFLHGNVDEFASIVDDARQTAHRLQVLHSRNSLLSSQGKVGGQILHENHFLSLDVVDKLLEKRLGNGGGGGKVGVCLWIDIDWH